jgi:hypothetical protein
MLSLSMGAPCGCVLFLSSSQRPIGAKVRLSEVLRPSMVGENVTMTDVIKHSDPGASQGLPNPMAVPSEGILSDQEAEETAQLDPILAHCYRLARVRARTVRDAASEPHCQQGMPFIVGSIRLDLLDPENCASVVLRRHSHARRFPTLVQGYSLCISVSVLDRASSPSEHLHRRDGQ